MMSKQKKQKEKLVEVAKLARRFFEEYSRCSNVEVQFEGFPHGACGDSSELLAKYYRECLDLDATVVSGIQTDTQNTHSWVSCAGFVVDITADQFGNNLPDVIVEQNSEWHQIWDEPTNTCSFNLYEVWGMLRDFLNENIGNTMS